MRSLLTEAWIGGCIALVFAGMLIGSAPLVGLGALVLGAGGAARLWARLALEEVEYSRELSERRAFAGEQVGLRLRLANRKWLPVPWLELRERLPEAAPLIEGHTTPTGQHGAVYLTRSTALRPGDRLEWPLAMHAAQRGYHRFGPARLSSGDLFGLFDRELEAGGVDTLVVYPRTYPLPDLGIGSDRPFGELRGGRRIFPDPVRVIGVRDYVPGDPLKQVDWKATARAGRLQSRLYEPSRALAVVVALDVMTLPHTWEGTDPVLLERGVTVAASLARAAFESHASLGLLTNGALPEADRPIRLGTGRRPDQLARVLEALADGAAGRRAGAPRRGPADRRERRRRRGADDRPARGLAATAAARTARGARGEDLVRAVDRGHRLDPRDRGRLPHGTARAGGGEGGRGDARSSARPRGAGAHDGATGEAGAMSWRGPLAAFFFLAAEALLWFVVLRSFATGLERDAFREVAEEILFGLASGDFLQPDRAQDARLIAEQAGESAIGGPSLLLIVLIAIGAYALMRTLANSKLPVSSRAAAGLLVSIAAVGLALQLALAEGALLGGAPWNEGILGDLRGQGASTFSGSIDPQEFVADPDPDRVRGASRAVTVGGIVLIWLRFLFAGRSPVTFERSLRSFGVGFAVAVSVAFIAAAAGADVAGWMVLPYFLLGALSLATAHAARAPEDGEAARRDAPWVFSVVGTIAVLSAVTALFILFSFFEVQRLLEPIGRGLVTVILWAVIIIVTPIFWVLEWLISLVSSDFEFENVRTNIEQAAFEETEEREGRVRIPGWVGDAVRAFAVAGALWVAYRISRWLFSRSERTTTEQYEEIREAEGGGGLASMLRSLIPGARPRPAIDSRWAARNRAYALFMRMLLAARARGIERREGQTALEFGAAAGRRLETPLFAGIARAFDGVRYGRQEPTPGRLEQLEREFAAWELANPLPEDADAEGEHSEA